MFGCSLVLLRRFDGISPTTSTTFTSCPFWVRVYNLALMAMSPEVGEDIGKGYWNICVYWAVANGVGWGRFIFVRVEVNIAKSLLHGKQIEIEDENPVWVFFKYEWFPSFWYWFDCMGHTEHDCESYPMKMLVGKHIFFPMVHGWGLIRIKEVPLGPNF